MSNPYYPPKPGFFRCQDCEKDFPNEQAADLTFYCPDCEDDHTLTLCPKCHQEQTAYYNSLKK